MPSLQSRRESEWEGGKCIHIHFQISIRFHLSNNDRTGKVAQKIKPPSIKLDGLSSIPRTHVVEGEDQPLVPKDNNDPDLSCVTLVWISHIDKNIS